MDWRTDRKLSATTGTPFSRSLLAFPGGSDHRHPMIVSTTAYIGIAPNIYGRRGKIRLDRLNQTALLLLIVQQLESELHSLCVQENYCIVTDGDVDNPFPAFCVTELNLTQIDGLVRCFFLKPDCFVICGNDGK